MNVQIDVRDFVKGKKYKFLEHFGRIILYLLQVHFLQDYFESIGIIIVYSAMM